MKKNLFHIIAANIFYLLIVAGTNFVLPKFTSIEIYAATKEYTLYLTTYSSILTFGYLQGMYVEYGGKKLEVIDPKEIGINMISFFGFMLPIALGIFAFGVYRESDRRSVMVNVSRLRKRFEGNYELENRIETVWSKGYRFLKGGV